MVTIQPSIFPKRTVSEFAAHVEELTKEIQELYCQDEIPWILGISWGKDSTAVLQLVWYALEGLPVEKRKKTVYVITTDTLVENPIVSTWVRQCVKQLKIATKDKNIPIEPHLLHPALKSTFWVCLIGKGYPAPRHNFRWCTDRMKIKPTNDFIRNMVRAHGESVLILGVRKAESLTRAETIKKHEKKKLRERIIANSNFPNALIYKPIEDWQTEEVWLYLMQWANPWGGNNKDLLNLYRGATADNECPLVVDTSTPSCGDSRFGCWVCTMVGKDKSMGAMIQNEQEKEWLQPLLDLRNELDIENDHDRRDFRRIYGRVELFGSDKIEPIPGPYTKYWREYWLRKVLQVQEEVRRQAPQGMKDLILISLEEMSEIRRIWLEEKHEFDDSLPKIYQEVTGEVFEDIRPGVGNALLGGDEWDVLAEICGEDIMHLELMAKLLDTERQYYTKSRRNGIYDKLEKCFESSSRSKEEAIQNAHVKRNLKNASLDGDVEQIKEQLKDSFSSEDKSQQLSWASLKFAEDRGGSLE